MLNINLLNWRDAHIKSQCRRLLFIVTVVIIICAGSAVLFDFVLQRKLNKSVNALSSMDKEIAIIATKIKDHSEISHHKNLLEDKVQVMKSLQDSRMLVATLLDDLVRVTPDDITFEKIEVRGNLLFIDGVSVVNCSINMFVGKMKALAWVKNSKLLDLNDCKTKIKFSVETLIAVYRNT